MSQPGEEKKPPAEPELPAHPAEPEQAAAKPADQRGSPGGLISSEIAQRKMEEAQAAILNAIPAHIALIDAKGVILVVNESWKQFASANVLQSSAFGVGSNYLEVCERATGECAEEAEDAGRGLRRVLNGELPEFALEYACHSPVEQRWYRLMVTPVNTEWLTGAVVMHLNVTARRLAEEAGRKSEHEQRLLAQQLEAEKARLIAAQAVAKIGSWETDLVTFTVIWSRETHRIFETNPATFFPTHARFLEVVHPEDRTAVDSAFRLSFSKSEPNAIEHRLQLADGRIKFVEERWQVFHDEQDRPVRALGTCQDITERKRAQEERDRLFNLSLDLMGVADFDGRLVQVNPAWTEALGWTAEELTSRPMLEFVHPDDHTATVATRRRLQQGAPVRGFENRYRRKDGSYRWFSWNVHPLTESRQVFSVARDVTAAREAQAANRLQAEMLDHIGQAVIATDTEGRVTYANRFSAELYGWTREEMLGRNILEITVPQNTREQAAAVLERLQRGESWSGEFSVRSRSGRVFPALVTNSPIVDAQGKLVGIIGISQDITESKNLEQQLLRSQRLESIGTLAGGIAHDLNNLLAPITVGVDLLRRFNPNPQSLRVISNIEKSAQRGADLVRQVLSFARGIEGDRVMLQVSHIIREVDSIIANTFPKGITLETDIPRDLWLVHADPTQLNQALLNLCVNARDAMPHGGRLEVTARNLEIDAQYAATQRGLKAGRYVLIEVTDTGTGMPPEIMDRIFEPFFTTKELGKGTGLGLSTTLGIVQSHGGFVHVQSQLGKGSTFRLYLPAQPETTAAPVEQELEQKFPRGHGELILVVDDERPVLEITRDTLEAFGYRVLTAEDGAQAVALYALHRQEIALVLTDMMMPVMAGPALIAALRRIDPNLPIIAASGLSDKNQAAQASPAGVSPFLAKPYSAEALLSLLKNVLTGKTGTSGSRSPQPP